MLTNQIASNMNLLDTLRKRRDHRRQQKVNKIRHEVLNEIVQDEKRN